MNGYLLMIAALVVTAGRLGDMFGRRAMFVIGMAVFAVGSVVSERHRARRVIIAGRVVQGVGGAAMLRSRSRSSATPSRASGRRGRSGSGRRSRRSRSAIGPAGRRAAGRARLAPDLLDQPPDPGARGRRSCSPPCASRATTRRPAPARRAGLLILGRRDDGDRAAAGRVDGWGLGRRRDPRPRWAPGRVLVVAFWCIEHRVRQPIVDFPLFRNGPYFGASAAAFALVGAYWSLMFFQPQYLQDVLGYRHRDRAADPPDHRCR